MLAFIAGFSRLRLRARVMPDAIHVRYRPLVIHQIICYDEIKRFEAVTCRPLLHYGGWGLRDLPGNMACNVSGNYGVKLWFKDGRKLLIGSQKADEFVDTVRSAME